MDSIGKRIRAERERLGLKQDQLGVAPKTQRYYENDERQADAAYLAAFAGQGADVLFILTGRRDTQGISADENALLSGFRAMDARGKAGVLAMIAGLTQPPGSTFQIGGSVGQVVQGDATFEGSVKITPIKSTTSKDLKKK